MKEDEKVYDDPSQIALEALSDEQLRKAGDFAVTHLCQDDVQKRLLQAWKRRAKPIQPSRITESMMKYKQQ